MLPRIQKNFALANFLVHLEKYGKWMEFGNAYIRSIG